MANVKVDIRVKKIHCGNTEDIHGADELYLTSILSDGSAENTQAAIVGKMSINDDEAKYPNATIFSSYLPGDSIIRGGLDAFDQDCKKDWDKKPEWVEKAKDAAVEGLTSSDNPKAVIAGEILRWGYVALDELMKADKDDHLGQTKLNIPATGPETEQFTWRFWNEGDFLGYSSWNYSVDFEIVREREPLYTAVWKPSTADDICLYGWTRDDLTAKGTELRPDGMRIDQLQAYVHNGHERWNAVFSPTHINDYGVMGWKRDDLMAKVADIRPDGMRFHILQAYVHNGEELWNAILHPNHIADVAVLGWKRDDLLAKDAELRAQNMRFHVLQAYVHDGQELWNAVWRPAETDETAVLGWEYADYREKYDQLWQEGWRLHILDVYTHDGRDLYNAVWRPSEGREIQVYGFTRDGFLAKDKKLRDQNMRLHQLTTF